MSGSLAIVGAGVFGASLARHCALAGWDVTLVEAVEPGHVRSGSGDESRLLRCGHGEDEWLTRSARRAWTLWQEIDPRVLVPAGVIWLARTANGIEASTERCLNALAIPCERVDPADVFPSYDDADGEIAWALLEPEAGILRARAGVRALVEQAVAAGASLVRARARPDGATVQLDDGTRLDADRVVWACGAWLPGLFPGLLPLRITQQDVYYIGTPASWRTPGVPGWNDEDGAIYGLGDLRGRGFKVAPDQPGPEVDPETFARAPKAASERLARDYVARRFPALAEAPIVGTRTCQYEMTPDARFVIAPHPEHDGRVWLLGGGSGHGFKHGPALAERIEPWLAGAELPEPMFGLDRAGAR